MAHSFSRYGVGIDLSKDHFHVCFKGLCSNDAEKIVGTRKFPQTPAGFRAFDQWLQQKRKDKEIPCKILMEVTGVYHENLIYFLHQAGYEVSLMLGSRVKHYLRSIGHVSKTDKEDSQGIASMVLRQQTPTWKPVSEEMHQIRQLIRYRSSLVDSRVSFQNQLHAISHSRLAHKEIVQSIGRIVKQTNADIARIEQQTRQLVKADPELWGRIMTIVDSLPGVGFLTVVTVLAETDGFSFIRSAKQLTSYAGYDIIENQSGKFSGKTRISKQGNARLRKAMYMPALAHIRTADGPLYDLYLRLLKRNGGIKKKARVAVQRKLLCLIYSLWNSGEKYDPQYHLQQQQPPQTKEVVPLPDNNDRPNESSPNQEPGLHEIDQLEAELLHLK